MSQLLRTLAVLPVDPGTTPSIHTAAHNSDFRGFSALFGSPQIPSTHRDHAQRYMKMKQYNEKIFKTKIYKNPNAEDALD